MASNARPPGTGRVPLEILFDIYRIAVGDFLASARLVVLDLRDGPIREGGGDDREGLRLRCRNGRFLNSNNILRALSLTNTSMVDEVEYLLEVFPEASRASRMREEVLNVYPVRGLHLRLRSDVFLLRGILPVIAHPLDHFPGFADVDDGLGGGHGRGIDASDFRILRNTMVVADEFLECFEGGVLEEDPADVNARLRGFFGDRGPDPGRVIILLGVDDVPNDLEYRYIQILDEDEVSRDDQQQRSEHEREQIGEIERRWRELRTEGHAEGMPELCFARVLPEDHPSLTH